MSSTMGGTGFLVLVLIALVCVWLAIPVVQELGNQLQLAVASVQEAVRQVIPNHHAVDRHGDVALAVRNCLDNTGPTMTMRSFERDKFYFICQIEPGVYGFQIVDKLGNEITAFMRGEGGWNETMNYLKQFGTRFDGMLPWVH